MIKNYLIILVDIISEIRHITEVKSAVHASHLPYRYWFTTGICVQENGCDHQ